MTWTANDHGQGVGGQRGVALRAVGLQGDGEQRDVQHGAADDDAVQQHPQQLAAARADGGEEREAEHAEQEGGDVGDVARLGIADEARVDVAGQSHDPAEGEGGPGAPASADGQHRAVPAADRGDDAGAGDRGHGDLLAVGLVQGAREEQDEQHDGGAGDPAPAQKDVT